MIGGSQNQLGLDFSYAHIFYTFRYDNIGHFLIQKNKYREMNKQPEYKKFQRFSIPESEIKEVVKISNCQKLAQLEDDNSTLEVQLPNIFLNHPHKTDKQNQSKSFDELESVNLNTIRARSKKNVVNLGSEQNYFRKSLQSKSTFYTLVKMMFPEVQGILPLSIDIIDTIFYNSDGSLTYVYTDNKRGLLKTKSKNYIEMFLKRKAEVDNAQQMPGSKFERKISQMSPKTTGIQTNKYNKCQYLKDLDYVALLRYKDQNFIRLKEHQFKSIFIRPVQANQKYKIFNNTLYIQLIPQLVNCEEGTMFNIQFMLDKHKNTHLFQRATQKHEQQTSYNKLKASSEIKNQIKTVSVQAYLLYIIFQIYSYINIHYHKQITYGVFEFMKVRDCYYLANTRKIKINDSQNIKNQYTRENLFEDFVEIDQDFNLQKQKQNNGVINIISTLFDEQNKKMCEQVRQKVREQIQGIQNRLDSVESNYVFGSINDRCPHKLNYLLQNQRQFTKFLKEKQQQLDGLSPLTSISNISRKKYKKYTKGSEPKPQTKQNFIKNHHKSDNNCFDFFNKKQVQGRSDNLFSKWYKQGLNGKKHYIGQKRM